MPFAARRAPAPRLRRPDAGVDSARYCAEVGVVVDVVVGVVVGVGVGVGIAAAWGAVDAGSAVGAWVVVGVGVTIAVEVSFLLHPARASAARAPARVPAFTICLVFMGVSEGLMFLPIVTPAPVRFRRPTR